MEGRLAARSLRRPRLPPEDAEIAGNGKVQGEARLRAGIGCGESSLNRVIENLCRKDCRIYWYVSCSRAWLLER